MVWGDVKFFKQRRYETIKHEVLGPIRVAWYGRRGKEVWYDELAIGVRIKKDGKYWSVLTASISKTVIVKSGKKESSLYISSIWSTVCRAKTKKDAEAIAKSLLRHGID